MLREKIKQSAIETFKLLWQFKWSITVYLLFYSMFVAEYFNPPEKDALIWRSEAMKGAWNYVNQEVYIGSMKDTLIILLLFFLIGTSNMRNHPILAKLIFLSPLTCMLVGIIVIICEWSWGLLD
jgi:hypothetical protein